MTREEAITRLKNMAWLYGSTEREQNIEAINMAIEALKADVARWSSWNKTFEQSGVADLISRADAIEAVCDDWCGYPYSKCPYKPQRMCDGCDTIEVLRALPSADRPQGEWICKDSADMSVFWYECSECGEQTPRNNYNHEYKSNYCPNCGAYMGGGEK